MNEHRYTSPEAEGELTDPPGVLKALFVTVLLGMSILVVVAYSVDLWNQRMLATVHAPAYLHVLSIGFWFVAWQAVWTLAVWRRRRFGVASLLSLVTGYSIPLAVFRDHAVFVFDLIGGRV